MFRSRAEARKAGWHSRRHQTSEAQEAARERYQQGRGPNVRKGRRRQKGGF